ncbi:hypothetical protein ABFX02_02G052500 [Erythranthe guttata]
MKIIESNGGALTNFEVLDLFRSRGAGKDPTRVIASVLPSEFKVFDYLEQSVARDQTKEIVHKLVDECKTYNLAKAEVLNIANIRPSSLPEVFPIIEKFEERMESKMEEFLEMVMEILPPHPSEMESKEEADEEEEEAVEGEDEAMEGVEEAVEDEEKAVEDEEGTME